MKNLSRNKYYLVCFIFIFNACIKISYAQSDSFNKCLKKSGFDFKDSVCIKTKCIKSMDSVLFELNPFGKLKLNAYECKMRISVVYRMKSKRKIGVPAIKNDPYIVDSNGVYYQLYDKKEVNAKVNIQIGYFKDLNFDSTFSFFDNGNHYCKRFKPEYFIPNFTISKDSSNFDSLRVLSEPLIVKENSLVYCGVGMFSECEIIRYYTNLGGFSVVPKYSNNELYLVYSDGFIMIIKVSIDNLNLGNNTENIISLLPDSDSFYRVKNKYLLR